MVCCKPHTLKLEFQNRLQSVFLGAFHRSDGENFHRSNLVKNFLHFRVGTPRKISDYTRRDLHQLVAAGVDLRHQRFHEVFIRTKSFVVAISESEICQTHPGVTTHCDAVSIG
jgi:hypothetical protein